MEEKSYIPLLSELTKKLSQDPSGSRPGVIIESEGDGPDLEGRTLYKTDEIAIMEVFLPKGNILAEHMHDQKEWLICFHGKIKFQTEGHTDIMSTGSCKYLRVGQPHRSVALEDSRTIVITIPADPGFPNA